jgi:hypothetical protein
MCARAPIAPIAHCIDDIVVQTWPKDDPDLIARGPDHNGIYRAAKHAKRDFAATVHWAHAFNPGTIIVHIRDFALHHANRRTQFNGKFCAVAMGAMLHRVT